tara:strand:+ start:1360 stop:1644 length:285 start_codon:yes stop_codon:yes gene_type:complete
MIRPETLEQYLALLHTGQWFGWSDPKNKVYENLIIHDSSKTKPTKKQCIDGLAKMQSDYDDAQTKKQTDKTSAITKLKELGLTDDEIKAIKEVV